MSVHLPAGWSHAPIRDLIAPSGVFVDGDWIESKDQDQGGDVRLTQLADIGDGVWRNRSQRFLTCQRADELRCTFLRTGDVLVARMPDPLGRACIFPGSDRPCVTAVDVCIVRPGSDVVSNGWLAHFINAPAFRQAVHDLQSGSTRKRISRNNLSTLQLPVPPTAEQHRIAENVDSYLTRLDAAVANLGRVQRNLKRYRASVLKAAVEGHLVPTEAELARAEGRDFEPASVLLERILAERRRRWEEAELARLTAAGKPPKNDRWKLNYPGFAKPREGPAPSLPSGWELIALPALLAASKDAMRTGPFGSLLKKAEHLPTGVPVLGIENIEPMCFVPGSKIHISVAKAADLSPYAVRGGDLLVSRSGTVGEACVLPAEVGEARFSTNVIRVRFAAPPPAAEFVALLLNGSAFVRGQVSELCGGTTRDFINQAILSRLTLPIPPQMEQTRALAETERLISIAEEAATGIEALRTRLGRLRQSILKWAFEGKLVEQDPNDEPASGFLERIRAAREAADNGRAPRSRRRARMKRGIA